MSIISPLFKNTGRKEIEPAYVTSGFQDNVYESNL